MSQPMKYRYQSARRKHIKRLLIGLSVLCFVIAAALLVRYLRDAAQTDKTLGELRQQYGNQPADDPNVDKSAEEQPISAGSSDEPAALASLPQASAVPRVTTSPDAAMKAEFVSLFSKNKDLLGWLRSEALTGIDFPVVQRDNSYYINHDFYGRENISGTVFLDESASIAPWDANLILHGHNMKNGTMFGKLFKYLDAEFIKMEPLFMFSSLYAASTYVPYAVAIVSTDPASPHFFEIIQSTFATEQDMLNYAKRLTDLSALELPVAVRADDRLLTLVTCHGDEDHERLIVALRELRPEEDKETVKSDIRTKLRIKL